MCACVCVLDEAEVHLLTCVVDSIFLGMCESFSYNAMTVYIRTHVCMYLITHNVHTHAYTPHTHTRAHTRIVGSWRRERLSLTPPTRWR